MSRAQRAALDALLRQAPQPAERLRESFAAFMGSFPSRLTCAGRQPRWRAPRRPGRTRRDAQPGTILYFHGGSFSLGSPQTAMVLTAHLVRRTGVRAISLDYRLAPEHPFPAAIEDCVAAFRGPMEAILLTDAETGEPIPLDD